MSLLDADCGGTVDLVELMRMLPKAVRDELAKPDALDAVLSGIRLFRKLDGIHGAKAPPHNRVPNGSVTGLIVLVSKMARQLSPTWPTPEVACHRGYRRCAEKPTA